MSTPRRRTAKPAFIVAVALALPAGAALAGGPAPAQEAGGPASPPARIGNIYNWRDHEPTQAEVQTRERASGVEPSARQRSREAAAVDRLYQQLTGLPPAGPGPAEHRDAPAH